MSKFPSKAYEIYNQHFKEDVDGYLFPGGKHTAKRMNASMKQTILNWISGNLYLGAHPVSIVIHKHIIIEVAYYGAGGIWDDLV